MKTKSKISSLKSKVQVAGDDVRNLTLPNIKRSETPRSWRSRLAFTLIELLVVIAIIAILAAMIIPVTGAVKRMKLRTRTQGQLAAVETAIVQYKNKHGFYPPDNPGAPNGINQLYYELSGTTNNGDTFTTLDRASSIDAAAIGAAFNGKTGFMNTMRDKGGDEGIIAQNFLKSGIGQDQIATLTTPGGVKILVGTVKWPVNQPGELLKDQPAVGADSYNPFRYVSTNPTNNPNGFDLWIDIIVEGKTNRFCNWSEKYLTP